MTKLDIINVIETAPKESNVAIRNSDGSLSFYPRTSKDGTTWCAAFWGAFPASGETVAVMRSGVWGAVDQYELADYDLKQWNKMADERSNLKRLVNK